jgi:hypothetical protein
MSEPRDTHLRRLLRRWTLGSGPLRRRSDRVQALGRLLVVLSFLVAPLLAVAASSATAAHLRTTAAAEAAERSRTRAVLLEDAATPSGGAHDGAAPTTVRTRATWPVPGGTSREGHVRVPPLTPAGTVVPVWIDGRGELTAAPLDPSDIPGSAAAVAMLPLVGVPAAAWTGYALLTFALDARRERRWEQEWAAVEPDWNSRLL